MGDTLDFLRSAVRKAISQGNIIEVEKYCDEYAQQAPELTRHQIQDVVLDVVSNYGGNAAWGSSLASKLASSESSET